MNLVLRSVIYVMSDMYFWPSMAFTTIIGIFIGSVVYDGQVQEIKKALILLSTYATLIIVVNLSRVVDDIPVVVNPYKPIASVVTIAFVTIFYLFGMYLGVRITRRAHRGRAI